MKLIANLCSVSIGFALVLLGAGLWTHVSGDIIIGTIGFVILGVCRIKIYQDDGE
jgi:hypothetical protein